ncbi:ParB/RepB/Spo0J family partition protein [Microbispora amethystogenes]|uniref:Transcriptional regulator n=1 Tax=Microbispora amethystogenes TaxID=1427754 RepID=A0ABQ4FJ67_9ACTN|nr:ParB/RepB/Spo0J family partition protein [Microbispora amethystogenes]GIH34803.1 hypothetical protein Mam01_49670 [Microbispora amethystogenes]
MRPDYGAPPHAEKMRALIAQQLKEARENGGTRPTVTIDWRGQPTHCEVIDVPVEMTYYNPDTHRIRAQRSFDPARDQTLTEDPWSHISQSYLDYLLKSLPADPSKRDPDFEVLKDSLREFKQTDPGLITHDGVLVNGNTRRAALKELGVAYIRVGVLPQSCTWPDVSAVELSLQLRKEHKRDYSYINRLLAIEEQLALGRPIAEIAREFRIKTPTCEQDIWILNTLREMIARSRQAESRLRLMDFEDAQEKLRELHRRYEKESAANKEHADLLKENRLAAIVLGFSKTDIRLIEPNFRERYLDRRLPDDLKSQAGTEPTTTKIPGLNRTVKSAGSELVAARALTDTLLRAKVTETLGERVPTAVLSEASTLLSSAESAFDLALASAGKDSRLRKRMQAAPDRINDACDDIEQCITDLVMARASNSLDEEGLDEAIVRLRTALGKLAVEAARSIRVRGDGLSWLLDAVDWESQSS